MASNDQRPQVAGFSERGIKDAALRGRPKDSSNWGAFKNSLDAGSSEFYPVCAQPPGKNAHMGEQRVQRIFVRVSAAEHELLSAKARAAGLTVSALVRDHIDRARIYNHSENAEWFRTLSAINNCVAALARAASSLCPIDAVVATAYLAGIHRQLDELNRKQMGYACEILPSREG